MSQRFTGMCGFFMDLHDSRGSSLTTYTQCDNYVKYNRPVVSHAIKYSYIIIIIIYFCAMFRILWY